MANDPAKIDGILERAQTILGTARQGLADALEPSRARRITGLHNVIVFGRSVSFIIQNLRSAADGFDEWYAAEQAAMKADPLMRFMNDARTEILKTGVLNIGTSMYITSAVLPPVPPEPAPPGATSFFIGDELGGTGWIVPLEDGRVEKYYVDFPMKGVTIQQRFLDIPLDEFPELKGVSVDEAATRYVDQMASLLDRARARFLPGPPAKPGPHLRIVKG